MELIDCLRQHNHAFKDVETTSTINPRAIMKHMPQDDVHDESVPGELCQSSSSRRRILQSTLATGVVITADMLPAKWSTPIVDSVILPAHAATSESGFHYTRFPESVPNKINALDQWVGPD